MSTVPILDVSERLVNEDGTPTEYFEEIWFTLTQCIEQLEAKTVDLQNQIDAKCP